MQPLEVLSLVVFNLEKLNVAYMVGGSFASSLYGLLRFTQDADLIIDLTGEQVQQFAEIFARDFYLNQHMIEQSLKRGTSFNIIHFETSFKVDFFILTRDRFHQEEFLRRRARQLAPSFPLVAQIQSPEDTILSKLDWYRQGGEVSENQWKDVVGILKAQVGRLDLDYLRKWAVELKVQDLLDQTFDEAGTPDR